MGASKWKVFNDDFVLGHFSGKTAEEAIEKAKAKMLPFYPEFNGKNLFYARKCGANNSTEQVES